jgi:hypothetical protein
MSNPVKMWTDAEFKKRLKSMAAINGKTLIKFTEELVKDEDFEEILKNMKRFKKNEKNKKFVF